MNLGEGTSLSQMEKKEENCIIEATREVVATPATEANAFGFSELDPTSPSNFQAPPHAYAAERRPPLQYQLSEMELETFTEPSSRIVFEDEANILEPPKDIPLMTIHNPPRNAWRIFAACLYVLSGGLSDGVVGALLPYIESYYNISYSIVSLMWMGNAAGFIFIACISDRVVHHFSTRTCILIGCFLNLVMYVLVLTGSKFPLIVTGFFFGGMGLGLTLSQFHVFLTNFDKSSTYLGYFHGTYGLGATISPLVGTALAERHVNWNYFYFILIGLMCINIVNIYFAFMGLEEDLKPFEEEHHISPNVQERTILADALTNKLTWLASLFVLFYQGSEVSLGGWIVTFLRDYRLHKSPSVGYVASGYWFGLTLGRLLLTRNLYKYLNARRGTTVVVCGSIVAVSLAWGLNNLVATGVFVSLAGVCIGPIYSLMLLHVSRLFPRKILVVSLTITTAFGSSGGALFPFLIGLISQYVGAMTVMPAFIIMFSIMFTFWICMPNPARLRGNMLLKILW
jgi:fucose permease